MTKDLKLLFFFFKILFVKVMSYVIWSLCKISLSPIELTNGLFNCRIKFSPKNQVECRAKLRQFEEKVSGSHNMRMAHLEAMP